MRRHQEANRQLRRQLDRATAHDRDISVEDIASVAHDAFGEGKRDKALEITSTIPPIKLGKTTYRVVTANKNGMTIIGPRGGASFLVPTIKDPNLYAHNTMNGTQGWYHRNPADGTFTKVG